MSLPGLDPCSRLRLGAALALLQPGIDPVFLVLLSRHSGLALANHGLVVGASQGGMAIGALLAATAPRLPLGILRTAAGVGVLAALATVAVDGLVATLAARALFGCVAGVLYAATLRAATARAPAHAMGTILFVQSLLATLVALVLPALAARAGPGMALSCLALVPLANLMLLDRGAAVVAAGPAPAAAAAAVRAAPAQGLDPAAVALFLFVAASAMIWSYVGAAGVFAGLSGEAAGVGVALGSVAACLSALAVARGMVPSSVTVSAPLAAALMAAPFAAPAGPLAFALALIAFNIGSTMAVAGFSALAIARREGAGTIVPAVQAVAMALGPLVAALAVNQGGHRALAAVSLLLLAVAAGILVASGAGVRRGGFAVTAALPGK